MIRKYIILHLFLASLMTGLFAKSQGILLSDFTSFDAQDTFAKPDKEGEFGAIWIVVRHEADIYIDDQKVGTGMYFGKLAAGEHSVNVDHWQYYPETKNVLIVPGYLEKVFFRLTPRLGKLEVILPPRGLMITLDGEKKGKLPLLIQYLIIGEHLLEIDNQFLKTRLGIDNTKANEEGWRGTNEGGKLKETGTKHWFYPNTEATNSSGFTALPGGNRSKKGDFLNLGSYAYFWSTTEYDSDCALIRTLYNDNSEIYRSIGYKVEGFSVRCLKD